MSQETLAQRITSSLKKLQGLKGLEEDDEILEDFDYIIATLNDLRKSHRELLDSLFATLAHAEDMTCELEQTDDLSEIAYIQTARRLIEQASGKKIFEDIG